MSSATHAADAATQPETEADRTQVWDLIRRIDIAMLVTTGPDGMRGRPMSTIPDPRAGTIHILTEGTTAAAQDVAGSPGILLSYQGGGDHVALSAHATVSADPALIAHLWNPGAKLFWPDGPEAAGVVALVITPDRADFWDGHGTARSLFGFVTALVKGTEPDLGERGSVRLQAV